MDLCVRAKKIFPIPISREIAWIQQQQTLTWTDQKLRMIHQKRERNQNKDLEKEVATETEELFPATNPDELEEEQTQHLDSRHKFSREHQTNFLSMRGWKSA